MPRPPARGPSAPRVPRLRLRGAFARDERVDRQRACGRQPPAPARRRRRVERAPEGLDRDRPHALGHPRPRDTGERPPALGHLGALPHRPERDRRELERAARAPDLRWRRVHVRDRRRGRGPPDRVALGTRARGAREHRFSGRPDRGRSPRLQRAARPLRVRRDVRRPAGRARGRPQGVPAGCRPRRRRELHRLGDPRVHVRDAQRPARARRRDRGRDAAGIALPLPGRDGDRARRRQGRLERGTGREGRLRDVHAQGDPRAGGRRGGDRGRPPR